MALKKREKKMLIGLAIIAAVSGFILYRAYNPAPEEIIEQIEVTDKTPKTETPATASSGGGSRGGGGLSSSGGSSSPAGVTLDDFQKHASLDNCWVIVDGDIYDISNILFENPNLQPTIAQYCGTFGFEVGYLAEDSVFKSVVQKSGVIKGKIK